MGETLKKCGKILENFGKPWETVRKYLTITSHPHTHHQSPHLKILLIMP
jgi:hypothetical protein